MNTTYIVAKQARQGVDYISNHLESGLWTYFNRDPNKDISDLIADDSYIISIHSTLSFKFTTEAHIFNFFPSVKGYTSPNETIESFLKSSSEEIPIDDINNKIIELKENDKENKLIQSLRNFAFLSSHLNDIRRHWDDHLNNAKSLDLFFDLSSFNTGCQILENARLRIEGRLRDGANETQVINDQEYLKGIDDISPIFTPIHLSEEAILKINKHNKKWHNSHVDHQETLISLMKTFGENCPVLLTNTALDSCFFYPSDEELASQTEEVLAHIVREPFLEISSEFDANASVVNFYDKIASFLIMDNLGKKREFESNIRKEITASDNMERFKAEYDTRKELATSLWALFKSINKRVTHSVRAKLEVVLEDLIPDPHRVEETDSDGGSNNKPKSNPKKDGRSHVDHDNDSYTHMMKR